MTDNKPSGHLEELDKQECLGLLNQHEIGRVAFVVDGQPLVFPVNYVLDDETVVFRMSQQGVANAIPMTNVAFEVDHFNEKNQVGWSVLVQGRARDISDSIDETAEALRQLSVTPWIGDRPMWIAIQPKFITGRRLSSN